MKNKRLLRFKKSKKCLSLLLIFAMILQVLASNISADAEAITTITVSGTVIWESDLEDIRPESVTVKLLQNDVEIDSMNVTSENGWYFSFNDLAINDVEGNAYYYSIQEADVVGYDVSYDGYNIINTCSKDGDGELDESSMKSVSGTISWKGDSEDLRPKNVVVKLLQNDVEVNSMDVTAENEWTYSFDNLDTADGDGNEHIYSVQEAEVSGYDVTYDGYNITNTLAAVEHIVNNIEVVVCDLKGEVISGIEGYTLTLNEEDSIMNLQDLDNVVSDTGIEYEIDNSSLKDSNGTVISNVKRIYYNDELKTIQYSASDDGDDWQSIIDGTKLYLYYELSSYTLTANDIAKNKSGNLYTNNVSLTIKNEEEISLAENNSNLFEKEGRLVSGEKVIADKLLDNNVEYLYSRAVVLAKNTNFNGSNGTLVDKVKLENDTLYYQKSGSTTYTKLGTNTLVLIYYENISSATVSAEVANEDRTGQITSNVSLVVTRDADGDSVQDVLTFDEYLDENNEKNIITVGEKEYKFLNAYVTSGSYGVDGGTVITGLRIYRDKVQYQKTDKSWVDLNSLKLSLVYQEQNVTEKNVTLKMVVADKVETLSETVTVNLKSEGSPVVRIDEIDGLKSEVVVDGITYKYQSAIAISGEYAATNTYATLTSTTATKKANTVLGLRFYDGKVQYLNGNDAYVNLGTKNVVLIYAKELSEVDTVDSSSLGVTVRLVDFTAQQTNIGGPYKENVGRTAGLLTPTVGENGYPKSYTGNVDFEKWFGPDAATRSDKDKNVKSIQDVNHLFLQDVYDETGYLYFSSFENYANLNKNGDFTVYEQIGAPTSSQSKTFQRGNFLPLNSIEAGKFSHLRNLYSMYGEDLSPDAPRYGESLYCPQEAINYYFGLYVEAEFAHVNDGIYRNENMRLNFNGDDDLWVYIDGVLVLDIGGIHNAQSGYIDFHTGQVFVKALSKGTGTDTTIRAMYEKAYPNKELDMFDGDSFIDGSVHSIQIFYMERGAGASNLQLSFNLPTVPKNSIQVGKELEHTDQENYSDLKYAFKTYAQEIIGYDENDEEIYGDNYVPLTKHAILNDGNATPIEFKEDGTFYLKPGQSASFMNFGDTRKYYAEEVEAEGISDVEVIRTTYKENGSLMEIEGKVSSIKSPTERKMVHFVNYLSDDEFRDLLIKKQVKVYGSYVDTDDDYDIKIYMKNNFDKMNGYIGYYYLLDEESSMYYYKDEEGKLQKTSEKKIFGYTADGIIEDIKTGQVIRLDNLYVGTKFYVEEVNISQNYNQRPIIEYKEDSCDHVVTSDGNEYYEINKNSDAEVVITNEFVARNITLTKKIDELQEPVIFKYLVKGPFGFEKEVEITFDEEDVSNVGFDSAGKSIVIEDVVVGEYSIVEMPVKGFDLVYMDTEEHTVTSDCTRIPFSTALTLNLTYNTDANAYFWNSVKEIPSYNIKNSIKFNKNGDISLDFSKNAN